MCCLALSDVSLSKLLTVKHLHREEKKEEEEGKNANLGICSTMSKNVTCTVLFMA
jgi:hypothetical protein